jgi:putative Ca2+/H+ antiporter (TMEM165/GDT1 family)
MVGALEIAVVAFVAQLSVLPGEKVQFIIAGLSTRYSPLLVVGAAGTAFASWTAIEIAAGATLQAVLPGGVLDAITAGLFLAFAAMLFRSAPPPDAENPMDLEADGGTVPNVAEGVSVLGHRVSLPGRLNGVLPIVSLLAVGEVGDKTQLVTIGLAAQFGASPAIWVGEMAAIVPVSLANAVFFHRVSHRFDLRRAHLLGAALFGFFGLDAALSLVTGFSLWEAAIDAVFALLPGLA